MYRLASGSSVSNPFFIAHANGQAITLEKDDVENEAKPQQVSSPGVLAGRFFPARDVDVYRFPVKKDGVYWLDVHSQRLGHNTNPYVTAQVVNVAADGKESPEKANEFYELKTNPGGREFNMANRDVSWRFQAKSDGYLRVECATYLTRPRMIHSRPTLFLFGGRLPVLSCSFIHRPYRWRRTSEILS